MQSNYREVKVVFLGDGGVGKTSILHRFHLNQFKNTSPTVGASFVTRNVTVGNNIISFQIWDTAGQEKYRSIASLYYKDASVAILVYDVTNKNSFEVLKFWRKQLMDNGPDNLVTVIVGNKMDLIEQEVVSYEEAKTYANSINAIFKLTSAKDNRNIMELFNQIAESFVPGTNNGTSGQQFHSVIDTRPPNQYEQHFYSQPGNPDTKIIGNDPNTGKPYLYKPTAENQGVKLEQKNVDDYKYVKQGYCC